MTEKTLDDALSEVYLQISSNILESFPKFRPPVDIYVFDEAVAQVKKFHKAEARLGTEKQGEVAQYARDDLLFLLRDDYRIYAEHLSKKLGLVLVEDDLKAQEVAEIFFLAFRDRVENFLDQPTEQPFRELVKDISILTEYLWADPCRVEFLTKSLHKDYDLAVHSVNTMFIGLALFTLASGGKLERTGLVSLALGLILHDLGMVNVPKFIVDKEQYLVRRDRDSIENHIEAGLKKLARLQIADPTVIQCMAQHHERLDGSGYPARIKGEKIGMSGRLCAVADSFSAMIGDRPYHTPKVFKEAAMTLLSDKGRYEPTLTKLLIILLEEGFPACKTGGSE
jgi:HD-GYP domain-containing protein (c-di-GMP phosphodiesterase class II)